MEKRGRSSRYKGPATDKLAYELCMLGLTNEALAEALGVHKGTLYEWLKKHDSLADACKAGREIADAQVAIALYKRACGYSCEETKAFVIDGRIETVQVEKHYPPDTMAASLWLRNRQPQKWRDRQPEEIEASAPKVIVVPHGAPVHTPDVTA